jgi:hypothetical protein
MNGSRFAAAGLALISCAWPAVAAPAAPPAAPPAAAAAPASATRPAAPTTSPFDAVDPEIAAVKRLDWKGADFDKLDIQTRGAALLALNKLLDVVDAKAEARAELLVQYIDQNKLGDAYAVAAAAGDTTPAISFDDAKKIAAAFIQTPQGREKFGDEFTKSSPQEQAKYLDLYEKTCRRKYDDAAEARVEVRLMANFLKRQEKLDDFVTWSLAETKRRQEEHQAKMAVAAADKAQADKERREQAQAAAERRRQDEQELAMKRLEYSYQQAGAAAANNNRSYYDDVLYGYGYGYGPGVYYYGDTYRYAARNRMANTYNGWNRGGGGGAARPVPRVWTRRR